MPENAKGMSKQANSSSIRNTFRTGVFTDGFSKDFGTIKKALDLNPAL